MPRSRALSAFQIPEDAKVSDVGTPTISSVGQPIVPGVLSEMFLLLVGRCPAINKIHDSHLGLSEGGAFRYLFVA